MAGYRVGRINEEVRKALSEILRDVKDPRVSENFISITATDVTPDMKYCKVYYSVLAPNCPMKEIKKGLSSANGYIRMRLAKEVNLRNTPELQFLYDNSAENGAHIARLLRSVEDTFGDGDDENREGSESAEE